MILPGTGPSVKERERCQRFQIMIYTKGNNRPPVGRMPMHGLDRRRFLQASAAGLLSSGLVLAEPAQQNSDLHLAPFRFDVTPPMGHSLCGGWIKPAEAVDDPLFALGF